MSIFDTMRVSMSGLTAQRLRMDVIASNVANVETTRTPDGGPYLRRQVVFQALGEGIADAGQLARVSANDALTLGRGVAVTAIQADEAAVRSVHAPAHPDADASGNLLLPDIDVVTEMTDLLSATRAYEANVTVLNASKSLALKALSIGR